MRTAMTERERFEYVVVGEGNASAALTARRLTEDPEVSVFLLVGPPGIRIPAAFPQPFKTR